MENVLDYDKLTNKEINSRIAEVRGELLVKRYSDRLDQALSLVADQNFDVTYRPNVYWVSVYGKLKKSDLFGYTEKYIGSDTSLARAICLAWLWKELEDDIDLQR